MTVKSAALLCLAMACAWTMPVHAAKSYDGCTGFITQAPATISQSGTWCLKQDINTSMAGGNVITVLADNVTVTCNDFAINGTSAGASTNAFGIYAESRRNVTVRNCKIRGFYQGLWFWGAASGGHRIEDNTFERNTYLGMFIEGDGSVVRRNHLLDTGGSTLYGNATGILTSGAVNILNNTVSGVYGGGVGYNATGILVMGGGAVSRNRVRDVFNDGGGEYAIVNAGFLARAVYRGNELVGRGQEGSIGLNCQNGVSNDLVKDNVITGFPTGIKDCGVGMGNDVTP